MPALNYQPRFGLLVKQHRKPHSIRPFRKRPIKVGDPIHHFVGMRTAACMRIGWDMCTRVRRITITDCTVMIRDCPCERCETGADSGMESHLFRVPPLDRFARADGFKDWAEMRDWFAAQYGLPFEGVLIQWAPAEWERKQCRP